jgi:hypothetical protein
MSPIDPTQTCHLRHEEWLRFLVVQVRHVVSCDRVNRAAHACPHLHAPVFIWATLLARLKTPLTFSRTFGMPRFMSLGEPEPRLWIASGERLECLRRIAIATGFLLAGVASADAMNFSWRDHLLPRSYVRN